MKKIFYILTVFISLYITVAIIIFNYPKEDLTVADSAIVLGAAVWEDTPSPVFKARINHAVDLYKKGNIKKIYFTGGTDSEEIMTEAEIGKNYAISSGVDVNDIQIETLSQTTMQNISNISNNIGPDEKVLIITDPLHEYRAVKMARYLDVDAYPSATPYTKYLSLKTQIPFLIRETFFMIIFWIFRI